jgi:hypothetical protein
MFLKRLNTVGDVLSETWRSLVGGSNRLADLNCGMVGEQEMMLYKICSPMFLTLVA